MYNITSKISLLVKDRTMTNINVKSASYSPNKKFQSGILYVLKQIQTDARYSDA